MYSKVCILVAALSTVSGFTLNTPANAVSGGISNISWIVNSTDPTKFSLMLNSLGSTKSIPLAIGIVSSSTPELINWPMVSAADGYTMIAVSTSNIDEVYVQSGEFTITPHAAATIPSFDTSSSTPASADTLSPLNSTGISNAQLSVQSSSTTSSVTLRRRGTSGTLPTPTVVIIGIVLAFIIAGVFLFLGLRNRRLRKENSEDGIVANATSAGVTLAQLEAAAVRHPDPVVLQNPLAEQSVNSSALLVPPSASFDPVVFSPFEDTASAHGAEALSPTEDTSDSGSLITISTTHATWGAVRYKVASVAHDTPSAPPPPKQAHPEQSEMTHHEPQLLGINSDSHLVLPQEPDEQEDGLSIEESALLLELREVQIARRLEAIRITRTQHTTPPPEYAS